MTPSPDQVAAKLSAHVRQDVPALPGRTNHVRAGVLLPLWWRDDRVDVVLTARADHLRNHPGEICFPGGRHEEGDESLGHTALREAEEEIALRGARILGRLSSIPLYTSDFRLEPFVAEIPTGAELVPFLDEVAEVVTLSFSDLLRQPAIQAIPWEAAGARHLAPVFGVQVAARDRLVFGGTAYALYEALEVLAPLFGRVAPPLVAGPYTWSDVLGR